MIAKYKTGSTLVLEHGNDVDYVCYCETNEERLDLLKHNHNHTVDNHYCLVSQATRIILACHLYPKMKLIEGQEVKGLKDFNVCDHKKEYKDLCLRHIKYMRDNDKRWYHIYATCMMFERNKPTLTKEQWEKVQQVHDNGVNETIKNYCLMQLDLIQ